MKIQELMTREVATVTPDTSLKDVARLLDEKRISGVPVCGDDGVVLGVVSEADILYKVQGVAPEPGGLLGWLFEKAEADPSRLLARTAAEAMTSPAVTIAPDAAVADAARVMASHKINRLPVVAGKRLVGIVTRADLVRAFHRSDAEIMRELTDEVLLRKLWLSPEEVSVRVADGVVELDGLVDNRTQAELAIAYAWTVTGVVDVRSTLSWRIDDRSRRVARGKIPQRI